MPEEPAVRVLAIDFTQEENDKGEVLFDPVRVKVRVNLNPALDHLQSVN